MGSTRFPGKVLEPITDTVRVVDLLYERLRMSKHFSPERTVFLTPVSDSDDPLVDYFDERGWCYFRGDEENVFLRFYEACERFQPTFFFRVCSDNPFLEPEFLDALGDFVLENPEYDYASYADVRGQPVIKTHYGYFAEIVSAATFLRLKPEALDSSTLEHVTPVFYENPERFRIQLLPMPEVLVDARVRLTVDTPEDLAMVRKVFANLRANFHIVDVYRVLHEDETLLDGMKQQIERNTK